MKNLFLVLFITCLYFTQSSKISNKAADSPADRVVNKIQSLIDATEKELAQNTAIAAQEEKKCSDEITFRTEEIDEAVDSLKAARESRDDCYQARKTARKERTLKIGVRNVLTLEISTTISARKQRKAAYVKLRKEHVATIAAIQDAYDILSKFKNAPSTASFVEIGEHVNKMFVKALRHRQAHLFTPVVAVLASIMGEPTEVSAENVNKLYTLFQNLEQKLKDSVAELDANDQQDEIDTQNQLKNLRDQLKKVKELIKDINAYISEMTACYKQEKSVVRAAFLKRNRNRRILRITKRMCANFKKQFANIQKSSNNHLSILRQLLEIVKSTIKNFSYGKYDENAFTELEGATDNLNFIEKAFKVMKKIKKHRLSRKHKH